MPGYRRFTGLKAAGILGLMLLVISCNRGDKKYIIPEKKFVNLLVDLHLAEAIAAESNREVFTSVKLDSATLYGSVFAKYNVTRGMFDSTMLYYSLKPERFQKIYNSVTAKLKRMEEGISNEQKEEAKINYEVLWSDKTIYRFPPLAGNRIEINVPISKTGIYVVSANVRMLPTESSINPRMTIYFYRDDGTPEGKRLYFQEVHYTSRMGDPRDYRDVMQLDTLNYTHIRGYILNYSNTDSLFKRNAIVSDIKVSHRLN